MPDLCNSAARQFYFGSCCHRPWCHVCLHCSRASFFLFACFNLAQVIYKKQFKRFHPPFSLLDSIPFPFLFEFPRNPIQFHSTIKGQSIPIDKVLIVECVNWWTSRNHLQLQHWFESKLKWLWRLLYMTEKKQLTGAWILSNLAPVWKITGIEPHNEIWTFIPFLNSEFLFIIDSN